MKRIQFYVFILAAVTMLTAGAETARPVRGTSEPPSERRQKMAEVHEKMATCLRSARPFADCKQEMMKECGEMAGGCPMAGARMGKRHRDRMDGNPGGKIQ